MMSTEQPPKETNSQRDGDDLTTILDQSQRADLTLLIARITISMRKLLLQNFDADAGLDKVWSRDGMTDDEKLMYTNPKDADVEAMDKQRKLKEEYEKDISSPKMKILQRNALKAFDDWSEEVLMRVGEVVNNKETVKKQRGNTDTTDANPEAPVTTGKIADAPDRGVKFKDIYQPIKNPLTKLSMEQRTLVLHSVLLLMLSLKHYNAPSRVLLLLLTSSLKLPLKTFEQDEYATAKGLLEGVKEMTAEDETKKKVEENKETRKWKVGLATAAGAALIGVTGGLAAPLVAAGVGSVMGGLGLGATSAAAYLGSVAGSTYLVGGLFGAYGGRMTGRMMDNYAKEVEDFEFLPVHSNNKTSENEKEAVKQASDHDHKLRVSICISGWLTEKEEVLKPWRVLGTGAEVFGLKYELEAMLNLGNAMNGLVESAAWGYAQKQLIAQTIFADLAVAMWPIGLLKVARVIDNPFNLAKSRSEKAGEVLADALINKAQGERPVTLIGYSLGARIIYSCLMSLAKRQGFGLIENAVLVGAPTPSDTSDWRMLRSVVSGRLVNVFSENDYVLGFMYRTSSLQYGVAGLQPVQGLPGVENVDVSEEVSGHLRYRYLIGSILKKIGFEDVDMQAVQEEKDALAKMEAEEKKKSLQAQRNRLIRRESTGGKEDESAEAELEASELEKDIQEKTQTSLVTKAIEYFYTPKTPGKENKIATATSVQQTSEKPSRTVTAAPSTEKAATNANQTLAQKAYSALPSMPGYGRASPEQKRDLAQGPSNHAPATSELVQSAQKYASHAASYLPSMPKNLPSMPSLPGRSKIQPQERSKATQKAENVADVSQQAVSSAALPTDRNSRSTVESSTMASPAKISTKKAPIIHQQNPPDINRKTSEVETASDPMAQEAERTKSNIAQTSKAKAQGATKTEVSSETPSKDSQGPVQSYASYAAAYLPSISKSLPSIPGWSSARKAPPKLERRDSPGVRSRPPKLERRGSSQVQASRPSIAQRTSSGIKSPPPKLGPRRTDSGVKSPG